MKLTLVFKAHGKITRINLDASDKRGDEKLSKYVNRTIKARWPDLHGTCQGWERRNE